jgi:hypothetical protein
MSEPIEQLLKQMTDPMKAAVELASAQAAKHVASLGKVSPRLLEVALEKARRRKGNGHHLCVSHLALVALLVVAGLEPVVGYAVDCSYFGVHRFERLEGSAWKRTFNLADGHRFCHL